MSQFKPISGLQCFMPRVFWYTSENIAKIGMDRCWGSVNVPTKLMVVFIDGFVRLSIIEEGLFSQALTGQPIFTVFAVLL